jgi:peptide/nickel transport system permease protein
MIGVIVGAIAGYYGGWVDIALSRIIEIVICFPTFFLILTILALVGPSLFNVMVVIGITGWTGIARIVRAEFLRLREMDFVIASRALGAKDRWIIFRHILPNALAPVLVSATFGIASTILIESSLSFLGFGVQPPTPSWGEILSQSRDYMDFAWWLTAIPGCAIFLTITAYNISGEAFQDAIDPQQIGK